MSNNEQIEKTKEILDYSNGLLSEIHKNNTEALIQVQRVLFETWKKNLELGSEIHETVLKNPIDLLRK